MSLYHCINLLLHQHINVYYQITYIHNCITIYKYMPTALYQYSIIWIEHRTDLSISRSICQYNNILLSVYHFNHITYIHINISIYTQITIALYIYIKILIWTWQCVDTEMWLSISMSIYYYNNSSTYAHITISLYQYIFYTHTHSDINIPN